MLRKRCLKEIMLGAALLFRFKYFDEFFRFVYVCSCYARDAKRKRRWPPPFRLASSILFFLTEVDICVFIDFLISISKFLKFLLLVVIVWLS